MFRPGHELFELLISTSPIGVYIIQNSRFKLINPEITKITGYSQKELLNINPIKLVFPDDRELVRTKAKKMLKKEKTSPYEFRIIAKDGSIKWILERVTPIQFRGKPATLGNFMDITKQKRIEQELNEARNLLGHILSTSPVGIVLAENRIIKWSNEEMVKLFGYKNIQEFVGLPASEVYASKEEYERVGNIIYEMLKKGEPAEIEARFKRKDGSVFWGHIRMSTFDPGSPTKRVVAALFDITWRKKAEKELIEEKERLNITLRSIGDGVICADNNGHIVLMNKVAEDLTGWKEEEVIGRPVTEVFRIINEITREPCDDPVTKVLETGGVVGLANHTVLISKDGKERYLADSGAPVRDNEGNIIGVILVFRDITEKRTLESEMQKLEKLEAIGTLAGGIAHEFNNMLMAILGNISLAKMNAKPSDNLYRRLEDAERVLLQAKSLTQQLLTFSKGGAPIRRLTSLNALLKDSAEFSLSGSNVKCEFDIANDLWPAEIDEGQISQVISNIVINAQQAMPNGGIVKIKAENVIISEDTFLPIKKGNYVKISIQDYGIGIPKEHLNKIFDPYFTTKQKGSGLGLAVAYSIIKNHNGYIAVESELGKGTRFDIYIPAHIEKVLKEELPVSHEKGRVLVMDDEELVLEVVKEMLCMIGYDVVVARDGKEALKLYKDAKKKKKPFDVVILDLTVPAGMGGKETLEKLVEFDPCVKAVVSSGYSNDPIMSEYEKYGFKAVIAKPYTVKELSDTLNRVMNL